MRVLFVHSRYSSQQPSGENVAVDQQVAALRRGSVDVAVVQQSTDTRQKEPFYRLRAAATVATGRGPTPMTTVAEWQPDVIHVHNLFPNFGRRWIETVTTPVVATLHNYRPLCPAGTFFRDGHACTDCLEAGSAWPSVVHGCYRGSRLQTLPVATSTRFANDPLLLRAAALVVLHEKMKQLYIDAGVAPEKLHVLSNFIVGDKVPEVGTGAGGYWLFVGRLSPEKGILHALQHWPDRHRLLVVGSGPLDAEVRARAGPSVEVLGARPRDVVQQLISDAIGLVFPSQMYEGLALVCLEALAAGTPILAWEPSAACSAVRALNIGEAAGPDIGSSLDRAATTFPRMRARCRRVFDEQFTEATWVSGAKTLYERALAFRQ